jgi:hypothetical protein
MNLIEVFMPTIVSQLISDFNLQRVERVKWGERIHTEAQGIYIVSLSSDPSQNSGLKETAPISKSIIQDWIKKVDGFEIDKQKTYDADKIIRRMSEFWLPDENILYIGKAPLRQNKKGIGNRVNEYYKTKYGEKRPHAGGHWLKALSILNNTYVYYTPCSQPGDVETNLLQHFINNVSEKTLDLLRDKDLSLPFGNLELRKRQAKNHGLGKMKIDD